MNDKNLAEIQNKFSNYAEAFFGDDKFVNFNLHLKLCHSFKVNQESVNIAKGLGLPKDQIYMASIIGLLHDIGRFPQFVKYKTYKDVISTNHGKLGVEEIARTGIIKMLDDSEKETILKAIEYHGAKEIPATFQGQKLLQTQIIRDADKIDIYRVALTGYWLYRHKPDHYLYDLEYPENGQYSNEVAEAVLNREKIDYNQIKTMDDARLLQLGWIFDINFKPSIKRIVEQKYLENLIRFMPSDEMIQKVTEFIFNHIRNRLN